MLAIVLALLLNQSLLSGIYVYTAPNEGGIVDASSKARRASVDHSRTIFKAEPASRDRHRRKKAQSSSKSWALEMRSQARRQLGVP